MSSVDILPNGTTSNTGALTGGATAHAVLSDSDIATYVTYNSAEGSTLSFADTSIPATAEITQIVLYAQVARLTTTPNLTTTIAVGGRSWGESRTVTYGSPTTMTALNYFPDPGLVDADIDGLTATISAYMQDLRVYRLAATIHYSTIPTVNVTSPTGTVTDRNIVTVGWTPTFDGTVVTSGYEVKIFSAAQYGAGGFDPSTSTPTLQASATGQATPPTSHTFTEVLANATYRAYVRVTHVASNGETLTSAWDYEGFVMDVDYPANPTLALTADEYSNRIEIDLTGNSGDATTDWFEVERSDDGEVTWQSVRTTEEDNIVTNSGGTVTAFDAEWPNETLLTYRARAVHSYGSGLTAASSWVEATITADSGWWLVHPTNPDLSFRLSNRLRSLPGASRSARQAIHQPIGATTATVISDTYAPWQGDLVVRADDNDARDALAATLDGLSPVLLKGRPSDHHTDRWVTFSQHSRQRLIDKSWFATTDEAIPWTEVGRPDGVLTEWPFSYSLTELLESFDPLALFVPDPTTGTVTDLTGNYTATPQNGAAVTSEELAVGGPGAVELDGTNDYVSTNFSSRRNQSRNPSFETNTDYYAAAASAGVTITGSGRTTGWSPAGDYCHYVQATHPANTDPKVVYLDHGDNSAGTTGFAVTPGNILKLAAFINVWDAPASGTMEAQVVFFDAGAAYVGEASEVFSATGGEKFVSLETLVPTGAVTALLRPWYVRDWATSGDTLDIRTDAVTVVLGESSGELTSSDYFDGTGYMYGPGLFTGDPNDLVGWLGTAHASASDKGVLANGTKRTFVGVGQRDNTSATHTLLGGSITSNNTRLRLATGSGNLLLGIAGTTYTFTSAWPTDTLPHLWALTIDEAADTATLYIDGALIEAKTGVSAQHGATQTLYIGAHGSATDPFDGSIGPVAVIPRALTAAEHEALAKSAFDVPPGTYD